MRTLLTGSALIAVLSFGSGCGEPAAAATPKVTQNAGIAVRVVDVQRGALERTVRVGGVLHHKTEADLGFRTGGVVQRLFVEEGAHVRRGQVLAQLEAAEPGARLAHAEAALVMAERDRVRSNKLHQSGAAPDLERDNAETGAALARANRTAAAVSVRDTTLVATDDGIIDRRLVEVGEFVGPGMPVFRLSGLSKGAVVRLGVADTDAIGLRLGTLASVVLDADPGQTLPAVVSQVATVASPATGMFDIEVKLQKPAADLLSGMTAKVSIVRVLEGTTHVPLAALTQADGTQVSVFVPGADGVVHPVGARLARFVGERAVLDGLPVDVTTVVGEGAAALRDGDRVRIVGSTP